MKFVCWTDDSTKFKFLNEWWVMKNDAHRTDKIANYPSHQSHKCVKLLTKMQDDYIHAYAQCRFWWATQFIIKLKYALMVAELMAVATTAVVVIFAGKFVYRLHTFLLTCTKRPSKAEKTKHSVYSVAVLVGCIHFWNFSRIDFIAFYFYVCFNNICCSYFI